MSRSGAALLHGLGLRDALADSTSAERDHDVAPARLAAAKRSVTISCPGCGFATNVTTRDDHAVVEDEHRRSCTIEGLTIDGSVDAVLGLPPK